MKVAVYRERSARGLGMVLYPANPDNSCDSKDPWFVGYVDLNIEKPKKTVKTVVKEASPTGRTKYFAGGGDSFYEFHLPLEAKNVKCTYQIEE